MSAHLPASTGLPARIGSSMHLTAAVDQPLRRPRARALGPLLALAALAVVAALAAPLASAAVAPAHTPAPDAPPLRFAQQTGAASYSVEVIVFRAASVNTVEDWNAVPPGRGFGSSAGRGGGTPQVLRILTPAEYRMSELEARLKTSGAWRPVAHAAWVQSVANWGTHAGIALSDVGINVPGLSGMVYLERAPIYMHLGFDMRLSAGASYAIREMRSVRYNDRQYFDNPGFGIIAVVTPIKRGDAAAASQP